MFACGYAQLMPVPTCEISTSTKKGIFPFLVLVLMLEFMPILGLFPQDFVVLVLVLVLIAQMGTRLFKSQMVNIERCFC